MFSKLTRWFKGSFGYIWLIVLAVYFSVLAGQSIYRNYQAEQDAKSLRQQLTAANQEKERLTALLVYYNTDDFREKTLRESLLLKFPDEKVYALPESAVSKKVEDAALAQQEVQQCSTDPNWRQWLDYLLGKKANG